MDLLETSLVDMVVVMGPVIVAVLVAVFDMVVVVTHVPMGVGLRAVGVLMGVRGIRHGVLSIGRGARPSDELLSVP